jgi:hypothetical protein
VFCCYKELPINLRETEEYEVKRWMAMAACIGICLFLALPAWAAWSEPVNWSQNNRLEDRMPWVSGNTLYFVGPKYDIYQSTWDGEAWSAPVPVPGKINGPTNEIQPCVVQNGKVMYFARMTTNGRDYDFFRSEWDEVKQEWGEPVVVLELSTPVQEWDIWVSEDETLAYVTSRGTYGNGKALGLRDIWRSERINGVWQTPVNLGAPVNSPVDEWDISVDSQGRLYISSNREGTVGDFDIFMAFTDKGPVANVTEVNTAVTEKAPFVSDRWLIFEAINRPGNVGGYDLWISTWE